MKHKKLLVLALCGLVFTACGQDSVQNPEIVQNEVISETETQKTIKETIKIEKKEPKTENQKDVQAKNTTENTDPVVSLENVVVLDEYFDFSCGYCKKSSPIMAALREKYGENLQFNLYDMNIYPQGKDVHRYRICADQQGAGIAFHDVYFGRYYGQNTISSMKKIVAELELDQEMIDACIESKVADTVLAQNMKKAQEMGARGTPFFLLDGNQSVPGYITQEQWEQLIDERL